VLLSKDGSIYLADFGLARIAQAGASTLSKDVMLGTPQYISPEQAQGVRELDEGTDIYSMGVVLYEMVVGRVPFNADTPFSIIHDHIYTPLPLPSKVNPNVPQNIERLLLKALSKAREDRFQSVEQLIQAFRVAVLEGEGALIPGLDEAETKVSAQEIPVEGEANAVGRGIHAGDTQDQSRPRRRWPWVVGGIGLTLLCLFVFGAIAENGGREAVDPSQDQAPVEVALDEPPPDEGLEALPSLEDFTDPEALFERAKRIEDNERPLLASQYYFRAGELFLGKKRYIEASESFLRSLELGGRDIDRPERAEDFFIEAIFKAAAEIPVYEQVERLERIVPEWPELAIFTARTELHYGELETARQIITQFVDTNREHPLALSVLAEVHIMAHELDQAERIIAAELENSRKLSTWVRDHLKWLQSQIEA
jgi:tetratricopeptide (TPR) repeat protein